MEMSETVDCVGNQSETVTGVFEGKIVQFSHYFLTMVGRSMDFQIIITADQSIEKQYVSIYCYPKFVVSFTIHFVEPPSFLTQHLLFLDKAPFVLFLNSKLARVYCKCYNSFIFLNN